MKKTFTLGSLILTLLLAVTISVNAQNIYWGGSEGFNNRSKTVVTTSSFVAPGGANFNGVFLDTLGSGTWMLYNAYSASPTAACSPTPGGFDIRFPKQIATMWASTPDLAFGINTVQFYNGSNSTGKVFTLQYTTGQYADNDTTSANGATWIQFAKFKVAACPGDTTVTLNNASARRVRWYIDSTAAYQTDLDSVTITSTSTIVPVNFSGISANYNSGVVKISWNNATEINTSNYQIERSVDGKNFASIGTTKAINVRSYTWYDNSPVSGNNFYRIKAIDANGAFTYSSIIRVSSTNTLQGIVIAPNPVRGKNLSLQLNNLAKGNYTLNIFNSASQRVFSSTVSHAGGNSVQTLSLPASVTKGLYNVHVTNGTVSFNKTIIVE